jgi:hypothetical protein
MTRKTNAVNETDQVIDLLVSNLPEEVLLTLATRLSCDAFNPTLATARIRHWKLRIAMRAEPDRREKETTMTFMEYRAIVTETV